MALQNYLKTIQLYADDAVAKPLLGVAFTAISLLVTVVYMILSDISKCFVVPPKSFPRRTWGAVFFKPKVNAPLVVPKPDAKDFREVLERGSRLVGTLSFRSVKKRNRAES